MINKKIERKKLNKNNNIIINEKINSDSILLINDDGSNLIISKNDALKISRDKELDLVCVSPNSNPPVCKIIDFKKYLFNLKKNNKEKNKKNDQKEIRISFKIEENDLNVKLKKVNNWINEGNSVKVELFMAGKEKIHPGLAKEKCQTILNRLKSSEKIDVKDEIKQHANTFYFFAYKKK